MNDIFSALGDLPPNPNWAKLLLFDRKGGTRVRFGDRVQNVNETERGPAEVVLHALLGKLREGPS